MTESHKNFVRFNIFLKTSEFNCLLNNFAEIFVAVFLFADVLSVLRGAVRQANRLLADDRALLCPYPMLDKGSEQNAHDQKDVC